MMKRLGIFLGVVIADQVTKALAVHFWASSVVYDRATTFTHVSRGSSTLIVILVLTALLTVTFAGTGGAILGAGIIGNVLGSASSGVIDFIHAGGWVFNLADVSVAVGTILVAVSLSRSLIVVTR